MYIRNELVEIVSEYDYLGTIINQNSILFRKCYVYALYRREISNVQSVIYTEKKYQNVVCLFFHHTLVFQ